MDTNRPHITPQGFVGVFIVLVGIIFLLDNFGLVQSGQVFQYWPLAPLGIGLLIIIHANETRDWIRPAHHLQGTRGSGRGLRAQGERTAPPPGTLAASRGPLAGAASGPDPAVGRRRGRGLRLGRRVDEEVE
jgi:hypothetical protein